MTHSSTRSVAPKPAVFLVLGLGALVLALAALALLFEKTARAQQHTFHLDRLEVPGSPQDGVVLFVPEAFKGAPTLYAQMGMGVTINSLRLSDIASASVDPNTFNKSDSNVITTQFVTYVSAGFELLDRLTLGGTWPVAWGQAGNFPDYTSTMFMGSAPTAFQIGGPALGDTRLDARYVFWRSEDEKSSLGAQLSVWIPSGTATNFGGDGDVQAMPMITGKYTIFRSVALIANTGVHFRPENSINNPAGRMAGPTEGLGVGTEWRWAVGALLPLFDGKLRLGADIFGQTGLINDSNITGNTVFTRQNTPIEWDVEGRMKLPQVLQSDRFYVGASAGSLLAPGYGAPDLRVLAVLGWSVPLGDTNPHSPDARMVKVHYKRTPEALKDTDGDGIPDEIDACPEQPEDHKDPDPSDGCPAPSDRDGDGIPDQYDKCPDQPEDKDGIDDEDGCPEDDADKDGIPDAKDACPKVPGQPDPDPKKNGCPKFIQLEGSTVRVLQQVHFATGSATILPDSFPMLQEIVALLKANPSIKKMSIEGHTDNRGAAAMNLDLSKRRAASVRIWLTEHGVEAERLTSEGYGMTRPIDSNETDAGRQANRRVEFKIVEEDTGGPPKPAPKPAPHPAASAPPGDVPSAD